VLDIGTGTGIVPRTLGARVGQLAGVIGCDRSAGMLSLARTTMPKLRVLAAEATVLPFRHSIFDVVTASFVLSHLLNYRAGLAEAYRILKPSGIFVTTSWTANTDPYSQAWSELLAEAVSKDRLQEAVAQVAPSEGYFENGENVKTALTEAGFARVEVHPFAVECSLSLERYLADRQLSSGGRFAQDALGPDRWGRFAANASEKLRRSFGSHFDYSRGVLIGLGHRP
jgi:ubiquinone/menaquinone biosynthesis C-methylase UbiE